ncbi:MAG: hypothetical protein IKE65_02140, partial [Clostridia bacterium]|nr:hypothetical protein [Clostridia bacterium]
MKNTKKILAVVLSVMLLISVMPFAAFAATGVANGAELKAAIAAAQSGDVIEFTADVTEYPATSSGALVIPVDGKDITIDLKGHTQYIRVSGETTVSYPTDLFVLKNGAKLTVTDTEGGGAIYATYGANSSAYIFNVLDSSELVINGGQFVMDKANRGGVIVYQNSADASTTINGGTFQTVIDPNATRNYRNYIVNDTRGEVEINGGTFTTAQNFDYVISEGNTTDTKLTINNGEFNGNMSLDVSKADTTLNGGTYLTLAGEPNTAVTEYLPDGQVIDDSGEIVATEATTVARIGSAQYDSLEAAVAAAQDGNTITLIKNCGGNGIQVVADRFTSGLTIDFNGYTYTMDGELVGSPGTKTQAFQLQKGNKITFKNGTIYSEKAKMLVQNYANLTLSKMVLTLDNPNYTEGYTLSTNNGSTSISSTTINANPAGGVAFDVCTGWGGYAANTVTVSGSSVINGNVEISDWGQEGAQATLNLNAGTLTGEIITEQGAEEVAVVKKTAFVANTTPEGYEWVEAADGKSATLVKIPEPPTATVTQLPLAQITNVATTDGKTITFDKGYKFVAQDDAESVQESAYKTYSADYVIISDTALPAGSVTLGGQYDFDGENTPWVTLTSTDDIPANTEIRLLQTLRQEEVVYTYEDICTLVREFKCAVKTNDASVAGADITVELRIYETEYNPETGLYEETGTEPIAIDDVVYELETPKVAQIGNVRYETLEAAFAAAKDGDTITLLDDCAGNGIKVLQGKFNNQGLTVDFAGHTYTVDGTTVGSTGTETQGFQLLKDNNITFQNGKIYGDSNATTSLMFLIQNYSNLTLDNMELELIGRYYNQYTLSNNNGNIVIDDSIINAPDYSWAGLEPSDAGSFAFDVCRFSSYPSVSVTVTGNSVINGDIQMDAGNGDAKDGMKLNLVSGTMNGDIVLTEDAETAIAAAPEKAEAKKAATFAVDAPEGYEWNEEGVLVPVAEPDNGQSITLTDGIESNVYLDADAYGVDEDEAIVKVTYNKNSDINNTEVQLGTDTYALKDLTKYVDPQSPWNGNYIIAQSQAPAQMHEDIIV